MAFVAQTVADRAKSGAAVPIFSRSRFHRSGRTDEFQSGSDFAVDGDFALQIEGICKAFGEFDADFDGVAGADHLPELDVVQTRHDRHFIRTCRDQFRNQNGTGLKTGLALQHSGEDRKRRIVCLKHRKVRSQPPACNDMRFADLRDFVQPEKRITMRNAGFDFVGVQGGREQRVGNRE